jgi:ABC-2 type transport system ATP-binding protein
VAGTDELRGAGQDPDGAMRMIEINDLTKVYGNRVAVWKVSFHVARGEIVGFIGPNGAGKTTTMRMLTGFVPPSSGTAIVAGFDVREQPLEVKRRIGYLCEAPPVYREMVVRDYLRFVAEIKRVPRDRHKLLIGRALELCGLEDVAHRMIGHLSKGYRQRVGLAQAILHEPPALILDEPTSGLDPKQIIEVRHLIKRISGDQTVILSTHILPEATTICSRVVVINEGQVVAEDTIDNLTTGLGRTETVLVRVAMERGGLPRTLSAVAGVHAVERDGQGAYRIRLDKDDGIRQAIARTVVESGAGLLELSRERATLEEVFLKLVTREDEPEATT